jgi:signal-transduction protein with cAMP-binding, CBS, and nucleotidyltransferase domain
MPSENAFHPTLVGRLFLLRGILPFDRLTDGELTMVAGIARARGYGPGETVHPGGEPLSRLLVVAGGAVRDPAGSSAGPLIGVASVLNRGAAPRLVADAAAGARVLEIPRRHFLTLASECPEFVIGLLEVGEAGARAR